MEYTRVSVSELIEFKVCRRKWYFGSIYGYYPKSPQYPLWFGSGIHEALESYYKYDRNPFAMMESYEKWYKRSIKEFMVDFESLRDSIEPQLWDLYTLGQGMVESYIGYEQEHQLEGDIIDVERKIVLPIVDFDGHDSGGVLVGKMDLILQRRDGIWIVDHKTAKQKPDFSGLDLDEQLTAYVYLLWRESGKLPRGAGYNVLLKTIPKEPDVLKSGKLSKSKSQSTSATKYRQAIVRLGLDLAEYDDIISYFDAVGWDPYFAREWALRGENELIQFEADTYATYVEMLRSLDDTRFLYPTGDVHDCAWCPFLQVCKQFNAGEDFESLLKYNFLKRPPRPESRVTNGS